MASLTSIVKQSLNLKSCCVENAELICNEVACSEEYERRLRIVLHVRPYRSLQNVCPVCGKKCPGYDYESEKESLWRAPDVNGVPVNLSYRRRRIQCPDHGVLSEALPWADGNSRFTADFNNEAAWLALAMPKTAVSTYLGINWRTVGNCIKAAHDRIEPDVSARLHDLHRICVDETSYKAGHNYITVVYDMERNRVVWIHEDKGLEIFTMFCEQMSAEERAKVEVVAGDGAKWIDTCTEKYFPNADRCVDFFHVVEWVNEVLDKIRIDTAARARIELSEQKQAFTQAQCECAEEGQSVTQDTGNSAEQGKQLEANLGQAEGVQQKGKPVRFNVKQLSPEQKQLLDGLEKAAAAVKGSKYALLHNPGNCTAAQSERLALIQNEYPDLYTAYQLKESLRIILHYKDAKLAEHDLQIWLDKASNCGIVGMKDLAAKIERHKSNILHSVQHQANSAKSEATNTTIKALIKVARGFRNLDNLFSLVYLKCSDLVVPLNNRVQMSPERRTEVRKKAADRRRQRRGA